MKCPTCNSEIVDPPSDGLILSNQQRIIYCELLEGPKTSRQLVTAIYESDHTGGPLGANHILYTQISRMNIKLAEKGQRIISYGSGGLGSVGTYELQEKTNG